MNGACFIYLFAIYMSLCEVSTKVLSPFLVRLSVFLLFNFKSSLYVFSEVFYQIYLFALSQSVACVFIPLSLLRLNLINFCTHGIVTLYKVFVLVS